MRLLHAYVPELGRWVLVTLWDDGTAQLAHRHGTDDTWSAPTPLRDAP